LRLTLKEIEARAVPLGHRSDYDRDFIFDLLLAYGRSPSNVTRLRSNSTTSLNVAVDPASEVAQKNIVYFKMVEESSEEAVLGVIEALSGSPAVVRYNTRFVIVTDGKLLLAKDTKTGDTLSTPIAKIVDHFTFFLPWAGMEKSQYTVEAHADVKAAERMAQLFDELIKLNPEAKQTELGRHSLNIFFTRLLFCFFAEDTDIFSAGQFTGAIGDLTQTDGSDMHDFLGDLFAALDTERREERPKHLAAFPYVNGRLFTVMPDQTVPVFSKKARDYLLESGKLNWSEINPDIFGSMFQAIVTPGQRSDLGQHYTSVPNILKTIEPLFLDALKEELDVCFDNERKLTELLRRIAQIKIFDPACGSGNFLIIAYKELRKLEHAILERLQELRGEKYTMALLGSQIDIENFYGIEIDDFAVEVAILSMWIAKHQMNIEFRQKFGTDIPLIPLKEMGHFQHGNAVRVDWDSICPNDGDTEIYLIGNPPYKGGKTQNAAMKSDYQFAFGTRPFSSDLDYISLWFIKGADYIEGTRAELSFVSTNSITQGAQVDLLFPLLLTRGIEIGYAYTSFKWENNARHNAGVSVVVINLRAASSKRKWIFADGMQLEAMNINGYLANAKNVAVRRSAQPRSSVLPAMTLGSFPKDGGALLLSATERDMILNESPESEPYLKRFMGPDEFINDKARYCLWITDQQAASADAIPAVHDRLQRVVTARLTSTKPATQKFASKPHRFVEIRYQATESIIIPRVSSERREYMPIGYLDPSVVISDAFAIYNARPWVFALLTSRMHMAWTRAVGGQLETRLRYSNTIVFNNFMVPAISDRAKERLTAMAMRVLDVREYHSELTLADLYDPDKMPDNLRQAHIQLDGLVDSLYRKREFTSDEERLSLLFEMYAAMIEAEDLR
jgi:hypothetical protein